MIGELIDWILSLDSQFAFLLALPFLVVFAGFISEFLRRPRNGATSNGHNTNHSSS